MRVFFLIAYLIPIITIVAHNQGGAWNYATLAFVFLGIPFFDLLMGRDTANADDQVMAKLRQQRYFRWITFIWVPAQYGFIIWAASRMGQMSPFEQIGLTLSVGTVNGALGITIAHELGHRSDKLEQRLSQALLVSVGYGHFFIEHNQGHHANVATPKDPATSRLGESFYAFYWRTVFGSWRSAWSLEQRRLQRMGQSMASHHNRMLWYAALPLVFCLVLGLSFGWVSGLFFLAQAWIAFSLLELINYIEHYGLVREQNDKGQYVKVQPHHSWNATERLTNFFLFNLQRHSDHHANATRRYQTLRHYEDVPQLPTGYGGMVLLALLPPVWFRIMNPRVSAVRQAALVQG